MGEGAYLHIGLPKTGTSYIQKTLDVNADALAEAGVRLLGGRRSAQREAVWDLMGRRIEGADQRHVAGAWARLAEDCQRSACERVILSEEYLVHARPKHTLAVARAMGSRDIHVVVTVRDLAGAMRSMWQQNTLKGRAITWPDYVAAVRDPEHGPPTAGVAFWLRYDLERILGVWADHAHPERTHVVVVPPPNAPPHQLFERFAAACGIDMHGLRLPEQPVHVSTDAIDTELIRRLNANVRGHLNEHQYRRLMHRVVLPALRGGAAQRPISFPTEHRGWATERSERLIAYIQSSGYDVVGDCAELVPAFPQRTTTDSGEVSEADITGRSIELLSSLLLEQSRGQAPWQARSDTATKRTSSIGTRWSSWLRSAAFRIRRRSLERADRSALTARAANVYLRRTRGRAQRK